MANNQTIASEKLLGLTEEQVIGLLGKPRQFGMMDFGMAVGDWHLNGEKVDIWFKQGRVVEIVKNLI